MFCTKCGHPLKEGDKFCENCGAPVVAFRKPGHKPAPAPLSRKKKIMNICFVVVAVSIIIGFYVHLGYTTYKLTKETLDPILSEYDYDYDYDYDDDDYDYEEEYDEEHEKEQEKEIEYVHVDAPEYKGGYNYLTGEKWVLTIEDLIVNSEGKSNDKLVGQDCDSSTNRTFTEGMVLTEEGKFYYINSDTAAVEFAPGTKCAELALDGSRMFYLLPSEKPMGKDGDMNVGSLYLFDTATGISEKLADNVLELSPIISPGGKLVAYTRFTDSKNAVLCIAGSDMEEKQLEEGILRACSVTDDGDLFYTNKDQTEIYRYTEGKSKKVLSCSEFNNYFVDGDLNEILVSCEDGAYYCDFEMDKAAKVYDGNYVTNMHTPAIHQAYGQFWATVLDVKSLKDLFFVSQDDDVFIINSNGEGAAVLKYSYENLDNVVFDDDSRVIVYSYDGTLYRSRVTDEGFEEEGLYDKEYVKMFYAGYDLKNIWLWIGDDIYYMNDGELECVIPDYIYDKDVDGLLFSWNIEDNKLYFVEDGTLYSVYNTESSIEKVADNCEFLYKEYGKLFYGDFDDNIFVYINGEFVEVY